MKPNPKLLKTHMFQVLIQNIEIEGCLYVVHNISYRSLGLYWTPLSIATKWQV
ncbi:hypothetical protein Hanom_Chr17g01559501 [Helianthus anomalus]